MIISNTNFRRFRSEIKKYWVLLILEQLIVVIGFQLGVTVLTKMVLDMSIAKNTDNILIIMIFVLVILFMLFVIRPVVRKLLNYRRLKMLNKIRLNLFQTTVNMHVNAWGETTKASKKSRMSEDIESIDILYKDTYPSLVYVLMLGLGSFCLMVSYSLLASLIVLLIEIITQLFIYFYTRVIKKIAESEKIAMDKTVQSAKNLLQGFKMIKQYRVEENFLNNHQVKVKESIEWTKRRLKRMAIINMITQHGYAIKTAIIMLFGIIMLQKGIMSIGMIFALIALQNNVSILQDLPRIIGNITANKVSLFRVNDYLQSLTIKNEENIESISSIYLDNISYNYEKPVLNNISQTFLKGETIGVFGASGSGKTTLVKCILGLLTPQKGQIFYNEIEQSNFTYKDLLKEITYLSQKPYIFHASIKENMILSKDNEEKMVYLCKKLGLHKVIMKLPNGYNTEISQENQILSTGECQRLIIVRALLKESSVYLFDEITSNQDHKNTEKIFNIIQEEKKDSIQIYISHSLNMRQWMTKNVIL